MAHQSQSIVSLHQTKLQKFRRGHRQRRQKYVAWKIRHFQTVSSLAVVPKLYNIASTLRYL